MTEPLDEIVERLAKALRGELDEASVKQAVVLPLLQALGWDPFDVQQVTPEFAVGKRRVDYALVESQRPLAFVEVKKSSEGLEGHEEQLLDYAFRQGVSIAILTNGRVWWVFLPMLQDVPWPERKAYTIDFGQRRPSDIGASLSELLSREALASGDAVRTALRKIKDRQRGTKVGQTLPKAWRSILSEPGSLLGDLLREATERMCGYSPTVEEVLDFLAKVPDVPPPVPPPVREDDTKEPDGWLTQRRMSQDILRVLQQHGGTARKGVVEEAIYAMHWQKFEGDPRYQERVSHGVPRWQHNIAWAKERLKRDGLVKRPQDSGRGIWELTDRGRKAKSP